MPPEGITPVVISCNPSTPSPGQGGTFTVGLSGSAAGTESYNVTTTSGAFSSIPQQVSPQASATQLTFNATFSATCPGIVLVTVGNNGGSASLTIHMNIG